MPRPYQNPASVPRDNMRAAPQAEARSGRRLGRKERSSNSLCRVSALMPRPALPMVMRKQRPLPAQSCHPQMRRRRRPPSGIASTAFATEVVSTLGPDRQHSSESRALLDTPAPRARPPSPARSRFLFRANASSSMSMNRDRFRFACDVVQVERLCRDSCNASQFAVSEGHIVCAVRRKKSRLKKEEQVGHRGEWVVDLVREA